MENLNSKQSLRRANTSIKLYLQDVSRALTQNNWELAAYSFSRIEEIASSCKASCDENHEATEEM